jgi:hypothetical protein
MTDLDKEWLFAQKPVPANTISKMTLNVSNEPIKPKIVMNSIGKPSQKVKMSI